MERFTLLPSYFFVFLFCFVFVFFVCLFFHSAEETNLYNEIKETKKNEIIPNLAQGGDNPLYESTA